MKFAVSTTAFRGRPIEEVINIAKDSDLYLEFSSGLPYHPDMETVFFEAPCPCLLHNYFPAPREPFVLNLGSLCEDIRERSIAHCKKALRMAARVGAPFYSAHAGFCIDPSPTDLGRKFPFREQRPRGEYWRRFVESVTILADEARSLQVKFLIENNVVAPMNVSQEGAHPLLCASYEEIDRLMEEVDNPALGILLDAGHLKVSATSLGFSTDVFLKQVGQYICGIHHSDNNGEEDTNHPLTSRYWFLPYMRFHKEAFHIIEVHNQTVSQIREQYRLLEEAAYDGCGST